MEEHKTPDYEGDIVLKNVSSKNSLEQKWWIEDNQALIF